MMENLSPIMRKEMRRDERIQDNTRLAWRLKGSCSLAGQGRVRNISTSGMLLELNTASDIPNKSIFSFDPGPMDTSYIPKEGQLVWRRKKGPFHHRQRCGIQFVDVSESILMRLQQKVENRIRQLVKNLRISNMVSRILLTVVVVLIFYAAWLGAGAYRNLAQSSALFSTVSNQQASVMREYQRLYADTTRRLVKTTLELNQMTASYEQSQEALEATRREVGVLKSILSQTELLLAEANKQNAAHMPDTTAAVSALGRLTNPQIQNIAEGRLLIAQYKDNIRALRLQAKQLRGQAYVAKIAHLRERDRARMALGNKGYFVREGQMIKVDMEKYETSNPNVLSPARPLKADSKIRIDVTVMQQ